MLLADELLLHRVEQRRAPFQVEGLLPGSAFKSFRRCFNAARVRWLALKSHGTVLKAACFRTNRLDSDQPEKFKQFDNPKNKILFFKLNFFIFANS